MKLKMKNLSLIRKIAYIVKLVTSENPLKISLGLLQKAAAGLVTEICNLNETNNIINIHTKFKNIYFMSAWEYFSIMPI